MSEAFPDDREAWTAPGRRPAEARRASRIECDLWVRVRGVDAAPRARTGNISVTGLYVAIDQAVGSPGDVVWLSLGSLDKTRSAQTMARVTRVVRQDDLHRGAAVVGAGFEFLPVEQPQADVVELVRHVTSLALGMYGGVLLDHDHAVHVSRDGGPAVVARLRSLGRDRILLSSPSPLVLGEQVRIDVTEPGGGSMHVFGKVGASSLDFADERGGRYGVVVRFATPEAVTEERDTYAERAVDSLMNALVAPKRLPSTEQKPRDLSGQLSRVQLATILSMLEMEALDATVTVANEKDAARLYVAGGRLIDAEYDKAKLGPRDVLRDLLDWDEGEFNIVCGPVARTDRFNSTTTALLMDVARERDEHVA
jgi:hypothetical protein